MSIFEIDVLLPALFASPPTFEQETMGPPHKLPERCRQHRDDNGDSRMKCQRLPSIDWDSSNLKENTSSVIMHNHSRICILLWLWTAISNASFCSAFQNTRISIKGQRNPKSTENPVTSQLWAAKKNNQSGQKRQPRFVQQMHKFKQPQQLEQRPSPRRSSSPRTNNINNNNNKDGDDLNNSGRGQKASQPSSSMPYIPKNVPWNTGKSVDDLETIMTKRWGAGSPSKNWSEEDDGDDDDYEIVYEDDDDGGDDDDDDEDLEPKEDSFFFRRPPSEQRDYYDQDDLGYEAPLNRRSVKNGKDLNFDHVIAPKPVGGRGTNTVPSKNVYNNFEQAEDESLENDDNDSSFYFRKQSSEQNSVPSHTEKQETRPKPEQLPFIKDKDGNPLLLTLGQAQKDFQAFVTDFSNMNLEENGELEPDSLLEGPTKSWEELGITSPTLLRNLKKMNCVSPLAVQDKACPSIITGNDVLIGTYTGSGKTLAFLVPLIERLLISADDDTPDKQQAVRVLVIVPGRELASQVISVARDLLEETSLSAMLAIGGTTFARNLKDLRSRKPSIVVGTPGRIAELVVGRPGEK